MDVRVDEARHEVAAAAVDAPASGSRREARDAPVRHPDVHVQPLAREGREDARALDHEVRRALAAGDGEQVVEVAWHRAIIAGLDRASNRGRPGWDRAS